MVRKHAAPAPASRPAAVPPLAIDLLLAVLVALAAVLVFHRATHYYFRSDDFEGLARARGLLPPRTGIARLIPWRLFFPAFSGAFGLDPAPYHAASLAAHAGASALVFAWLRPLTGPWGALIGAAFYAAHPAHYGSAYWISAIGDPLAIAFALLALVLRRATSPARWLALPAFALALLSKESAFLVPLAALCEPALAHGSRDSRGAAPARRESRSRGAASWRDSVLWCLLAMAAATIGYYLLADPIGTRTSGAQAYAPTLGFHVGENLLTYAGWTLDFVTGLMRSMSDAVETSAYPWGVAAILLVVAGAFVPELRRRGWLAGGVLWLAAIAPVLPLAHHTYRYYLGGPLAGAALCVAALASVALERRAANGARDSRAAAPIAAGVVAALLTLNGWALVRTLEFAPFARPELRADAYVDRALIAGRAIAALRSAPLPAGVTLRFWSPASRAAAGLPDSLDAESYWEKNVRSALLDGLGVRVAFPAVRRVEFVPRFTPAADSVWYAVYRIDGDLRAGSASSLAKALAGMQGR